MRKNPLEMSDLKVPIISVIIGEGGSGGAFSLAVADEVWMLEHTIYAVLSPEGFASILWKDGSRERSSRIDENHSDRAEGISYCR